MGGKQSTEISGQTAQIKHPKFTNSKFLKDQLDQQYIQINIPVVNEKQYKDWVSKIQQKDSPIIRNQSLMIPTQHSFKKEGMCGSSGFVSLNYQNFPFLLCDQILNRRTLNNKQFEQNQLWYLLFTLTCAAKQFHQRGLKVGDIRPANIFINQDGQVKMGTQYSWPGQPLNYAKTFYEKEITFLCPEQIKDINYGKTQSSISPQNSQSFAIGLTCLDAALLTDSQLLYNKNGKIDFNQLTEKINTLRSSQYSQLFCLVISNLCQTQQENRCTSLQLFDWLIPHEDAISNLQDFQVNVLPEKIERTKNRALGITSNMNSGIVRQSQPINMPIQQYNPQTQSPHNSSSRVHQYPQQILNNLPPGAKITGPPLTYQQMMAHQRGEFIPGLPIVQNPNNNLYQGQNLSNMNVPISASNYIPVQQQQQQYYYQQGQGQMPPPQQIVINQQLSQKYNYQQQRPQSGRNNQINNQYNKTLQKIDQQLKQSRKMFPS